MLPVAPFKYRAFLSYSHRDHEIGEKLHAALEHYAIPSDLAGKAGTHGEIPGKLRPIFRDRYDLEAGHSLREQITWALEQSEALIVLCSPAAAKSPYVGEEIRQFKKLGRSHRIYPMIIAGEPGHAEQACFPPNIRRKAGADGELTDELEEPLASDARPQGDGWDLARLKLIAGLIGVDLDTLRRREAESLRRQRRFWIGVSAVMGVLAVAAVASSIFAWNEFIQKSAALDKNQKLTASILDRASSLVDKSVATTDEFGVPARVGLKILDEADGIFKEMDRLGASSEQLAVGRARMLMTLSDSLSRIGKVSEQKLRADEAFSIASGLLGKSPADSSLVHLNADALLRVGNVYSTRRELNQALQTFDQALILRLKQLGGLDTTNKEHLTALATLYNAIAVTHNRRSQPNDALDAARKSAAAADRLAATGATVLESSEKRVPALIVIADMYRQLKKRDDALDTVSEGLRAVERALAAASDNVPWQRRKAHLYLIRGDVERSQYDFAKALEHYEESFRIRERLTNYDPQNATLSSEASYSRIKIGEVYSSLNKLDLAEQQFQRAAVAYRAIINLNPGHQTAARQLIDALDGVGEVKRRNKDQVARLQAYEERLAVAKRLLDSDPESRDAVRTLAASQSLLGNAYLEQNEPGTAMSYYDEALKLLRGLDKPSLTDERTLAESLEKLAVARRDRGEMADALASIIEAIAIHRRHVSVPKPTDGAKLRLAASLQELADIKLKFGAIADGLQAALEARDLREQLLDAKSSDESLRQLARAYEQIGTAELARSNNGLARTEFERSLNIRKDLLRKADEPQRQRNLGETWRLLGEAKRANGDCSAIGDYQSAQDLVAAASLREPGNQAWKTQIAVIKTALAAPIGTCATSSMTPSAGAQPSLANPAP